MESRSSEPSTAKHATLNVRGRPIAVVECSIVKTAIIVLLLLLAAPTGAAIIIGTPLQQSNSQREQLLSAAGRRVPAEAQFEKFDAWEAAPWSQRPHANVLFGPAEVSTNQFMMFRVACERNARPARWRCKGAERMDFIFAGDMSRAIHFEQDIDFVTAKAIYDEANRTCSIRYESADIWPDGIWRTPTADEYNLDTAECRVTYRVIDGVVSRTARHWHRIE